MSTRKPPPPPPDPARIAAYRTQPEFRPLQLAKHPHLRQFGGAVPSLSRPVGADVVRKAAQVSALKATGEPIHQENDMSTDSTEKPAWQDATLTLSQRIRAYLHSNGDATASEMGKAFGLKPHEFTNVNATLNALEKKNNGNPRIVRRAQLNPQGRIVWGLEWIEAPTQEQPKPPAADAQCSVAADSKPDGVVDLRTVNFCAERFTLPTSLTEAHFAAAPQADTGVSFWLSDKGELQIERGASDFRFDVATTKRLYKLLVGCVVLEEA